MDVNPEEDMTASGSDSGLVKTGSTAGGSSLIAFPDFKREVYHNIQALCNHESVEVLFYASEVGGWQYQHQDDHCLFVNNVVSASPPPQLASTLISNRCR